VNVAVLTLTRDRLEYTQHCFAKLAEYAGCEYDHYVYDNGSSDGTAMWLAKEFRAKHVTLGVENIGIPAAMNFLLDSLLGTYDVIVTFDNDCELVQSDTLKTVCELVDESGQLLSPRILGLQNPPASQGEFWIGQSRIVDIPQIGGIFLAAPAYLYDTFRYDTRDEREDVQVCWHWRARGGRCGYVDELEAWHYETTDGQMARYVDYTRRKYAELGLPCPV